MDKLQFEQYENIPKEKFAFAKDNALHDIKLETKPVGYIRDAFNRFCKNKSSVVAAIIIIILILFAIFVPIFSPYNVSFRDSYYKTITPSLSFARENHWGFWNGAEEVTGNQAKFDTLNAIGYEYQYSNGNTHDHSAILNYTQTIDPETGSNLYDMEVDSYYQIGYIYLNITESEYDSLQRYQNENNIQVIYPLQNNFSAVGANYWFRLEPKHQQKATENQAMKEKYADASKALAERDADGNYIPDYKTSTDPNAYNYTSLRLNFGDSPYAEGKICETSAPVMQQHCSQPSYPVLYDDNGNRYIWYSDAVGYVFETETHTYEQIYHDGAVSIDSAWYADEEKTQPLHKANLYYCYAFKNQTGYKVRVNYYEYFRYINGHYANFVFGTNSYGQDILTCLASGARLSFLLSLGVCLINFFIGTIYGAVEGYYGGVTDMVMERISDILSGVPFMVVATLFQLHLADKAGPVLSMLFAFVLTGWIGMASTVRMQFYRFKNQEYVLAARTLGANDGRVIWKHIFPNTLGTIITGSVLAIPGVIFSESMLSYLGIVDLEVSSMTSIGTMLSQGNGLLRSYPHVIFFPALFISLLEISFNLFGNGLRDAFNPSLRGAED